MERETLGAGSGVRREAGTHRSGAPEAESHPRTLGAVNSLSPQLRDRREWGDQLS